MTASNGADSRRRIGLLILLGFQAMCFSAFSVFEVANKKAAKTIYDLYVLPEKGGPVSSSFGMGVSTERAGTRDFDTILIGVGMDIPLAPPRIISYLKEASRTTRRLASICLRSFVLGDAGLLQKRRATTHWRFADEFQRRFPETRWRSIGSSSPTDRFGPLPACRRGWIWRSALSKATMDGSSQKGPPRVWSYITGERAGNRSIRHYWI